MISTKIGAKDFNEYKKIDPYFKRAFDELEKIVAENTPVGKYVIEEDRFFYMVQEYEAKDTADSKFESHSDFIDIQAVLEGKEQIRFDRPEMLKMRPDKKGDTTFFDIDSESFDSVMLTAGELVVIYPEEAHAPGIKVDEENKNIRKVVFKIRY